MPSSQFKFKRFEIHQDRCAMKVGTDGVILGAWINPGRKINRILDIGTGTGLLALMMAQKSGAMIDAIDIDASSITQAEENFRISPWSPRLRAIHSSLQEFSRHSCEKYDLIVSNPPYFNNAFKASDQLRALARHTDESLSFEELIEGVVKLLSKKGIFYLILPYKEGSLFENMASAKGLFAFLMVKVLTRKGKPPKRWLMAFSFLRKKKKTGEIVIQDDDGAFSNEYRKLTGDFYLGLKSHRQQ
jgi:tRNA1Val (adenine37-N6)-methyltransferase